MNNDSKEKIIEDWNKIWEPSPLEKAFVSLKDDTAERNLTDDFEVVYRKLEKFAKAHGKQTRSRKGKERERFKKGYPNHRITMKTLVELWDRAKKLKKRI